jgi:hypothetical protein
MPTRGQETDRRTTPRRRLTEERGIALTEFALILPLLMLLLLGMVDFGKAFTMWIDETHLANSAARYAAVNSAPTGACVTQPCLEANIKDQADTQELRDTMEVCVEFPSGTGLKGEPVRVVVTGKAQFFTFLTGFVPGLDGAGKKTLHASATMRLESDYDPDNPKYTPVSDPPGC